MGTGVLGPLHGHIVDDGVAVELQVGVQDGELPPGYTRLQRLVPIVSDEVHGVLRPLDGVGVPPVLGQEAVGLVDDPPVVLDGDLGPPPFSHAVKIFLFCGTEAPLFRWHLSTLQ